MGKLLAVLGNNPEKITGSQFSSLLGADLMKEYASKEVKRAVSFLSSISAVDGCIVLTDKLRLLGFGAEINATSSLEKVK